MLIRQDFDSELPPSNYLMQVTDAVTKVYCYLWKSKNADNRCKMTWRELSRHFNKNTFRTSVRRLVNEGLANYDDDESGMEIELVDWKNIE